MAGKNIGDVPPTITAAINDLKAKAASCATRVKAALDKVGVGMTQADVDSVVASLNGVGSDLDAIAATPTPPAPPSP